MSLPLLVFAPAFILAPFIIGPVILFAVIPVIIFTQEKDLKSKLV
ncbi:MAG TPA: hypothetical protein VLV31_01755 [Candidatus Acidoferrales bacterium]|nr:hypothetical protein [Candidatus Acidoferrales bacterium]